MPFINPYNFVRPGTIRPPAGEPAGHDRFTGRQGSLTCQLKAVTHLFVPASRPRARSQHNTLSFRLNPEGQAVIPGTSLKGCLRSLAEAISTSCSPFVERQNGGELTPCTDEGCLCICCRMFGWLHGEQRHRGNIAIGDAVQLPDPPDGPSTTPAARFTIPELGTPDPKHAPFYPSPQEGRKYYYNRSVSPAALGATVGPRNSTIQPVLPGARFEFTLGYENLTDIELGLLCYALEPGPRMFHKIGAGKPLGLGSCCLQVVHWQERDQADHYASYDGDTALLENRAQIQQRMGHFKGIYVQQTYHLSAPEDLWAQHDDNLADLQAFLEPSGHRVPIRYPGRAWFDANPHVELPSTQAVKDGTYLPD